METKSKTQQAIDIAVMEQEEREIEALVKEIEVIEEEIVQETKKIQKTSMSYTLKSLGNNIQKLEEEKLLTKEEGAEMKKLAGKALKQWMTNEFNL